MVHLVISAVVAIVVAGVLFFLGARFLPRGALRAPAGRDAQPWDLPADRRRRADDIDELRLPVALRGYRFAETDLLLDRLADEIRARDEEIARLRGDAPVDGAGDDAGDDAVDGAVDENGDEDGDEDGDGDGDAAATAAMTPVAAADDDLD